MYQRMILIMAVIFSGLFFWSGCDDGQTNPGDQPENGTLRIFLTDSPADYEAVKISFSEISAHIDDQWTTVVDTPRTVNLLEWNNGKSLEIGTAELPAGRYSQVRLKIDSAEVVVDGQAFPADVPSGAQSGLKLLVQFTLEPGSLYELMLDFDAHRSVVRLGPPHNPRGYKIKPVIRAIPRATSGSISGLVSNPENLPMAYALQAADTITSAPVEPLSGAFLLPFLPQGSYTVAIEDTISQTFRQDSVMVEPGADTNLGSITLQ